MNNWRRRVRVVDWEIDKNVEGWYNNLILLKGLKNRFTQQPTFVDEVEIADYGLW